MSASMSTPMSTPAPNAAGQELTGRESTGQTSSVQKSAGMQASTPLLQAVDVTKIFTGGIVNRTETIALDDFSLSIYTDRPSIISVVGESGSGKSTMARMLLGLESPTGGKVLYKGEDLKSLSSREMQDFRREVQAVFQDPFGVYNSFYKVDHVFNVPIRKFGLAKSKTDARNLILGVLDAVGLRPQETLGRYPHQLSGGQRQRIMVARALLLNPQLIIADEPVSMIDASLRAQVLDTLRKLNQERGISLVYITHDLTTAYQIGSDIIVLYGGKAVELGAVDDVVKAPQHPYTQLLVSSIPRPDPSLQWSDEPESSAIGQEAKKGVGCNFADRCPYAFDRCIVETPPLYRIGEHQAATCFLHAEKPVLPVEKMDHVFVRNVAQLTSAGKETVGPQA
ncbi:MAG: ABC transporter ATP-binding protein [Litorilinea sp.]